VTGVTCAHSLIGAGTACTNKGNINITGFTNTSVRTGGDVFGAINAAGTNVNIDTKAGTVTNGITATGTNQVTVHTADVVGPTGINATSTNGPVTVDTQGVTIGTAANGINTVVNGGGAGNVAVTTGNSVTGATNGINATTNGIGNVTVSSLGGPVTGAAGAGINATITGAAGGNVFVTALGVSGTTFGINATTNGTQNVTVADTDTVTASAANSTGVNASATNGTINITVNSVINTSATGTNFGINATTTGGNINIQTGPGVIQANGTATSTGIQATSGGGNINGIINGAVLGGPAINMNAGGGSITLTTNAAETDAAATAVTLTTTGAGNILYTANNGPVTGATGGINATNTAGTTGGITINANANVTVTGAAGTGINAAITGGTGNVQVSGTGNVVGTGAGTQGINATTTDGGSVLVNLTGTVTDLGAGSTAINATSGTGNVVVVTQNAVNGANTGVTGGATGINAATGGAGTVAVQTFGTVTGNTAVGINTATATGSNTVTANNTVTGNTTGINATSTTGPVQVNGTGAVTGATALGINATSAGGNVSVAQANTVTGATTGINAATTGAGTATVIAGFNVTGGTGGAGSGITTSVVNGNSQVTAFNTGTTITGVGTGNSGIASVSTGAGNIGITAGGGTRVTNTTGRAVTMDTSAGTGGATLRSDGTLVGLGNVTDATIRLLNNNSANAITINNGLLGTITNATNNPAGWSVVTSLNGTNPSPNTQAVIINNQNLINGRVFLGAGASAFNNLNEGVWNVSGATTALGDGPASQLGNGSTIANALEGTINIGISPASFTGFVFTNAGGAQTGTNTFSNNGLVNSTGNVNFEFRGGGSPTVITNNGLNGNVGIFNVGSVPGSTESTSFTSAGVQTVTNTGTFNIIGLGTGTASIGNATLAAAGPTGVGALNFTGANGSSFNNTGGLINMQADGGSTRNAVTLNTVTLNGTSDLNYSYTWVNGAAYNWIGGNNSRLAVDTFLGGPGSTSDRLVVGGSVSGNTLIKVNDTNPGAGAFNPVGITVVAVAGGGATNFRVDPTSLNYVNLGPLGAINKGMFIEELVYVPGGAIGAGSPNGNAYKFIGVPGPFAFNLPVATTGAQTIFQETADVWEDRQIETRNCMDHGLIASGQAYGAGADLNPRLKGPALLLPNCGFGVWTKMLGSHTARSTQADLNQLGLPVAGLTFDNSYRQTTEGVLAGVDFGRAELTSPFDSIVFSVMGGYITSFLNFDSPNTLVAPDTTTSFKYTGGTVGGSVTYMYGGFFIDALIKGDFLNMDIAGIPGAFCAVGAFECSQGVNVRTWGTVDNIGYRFQLGRYFIEPLATLMWTRTRIDNLFLPGAGVVAQWNTASRVDLGGGARVGGIMMDNRTNYVEVSFTGRVWDRVSSDNNSVTFLNPGLPFTLTDNFKRSYGETAVQLDWINRYSGWSAYTKVDAKFNSELQTYTAKAGIRYQFGYAPVAAVVTK
jgi:hypothetical protein